MEAAGATTSAAGDRAEAYRLLGIAEKLLQKRDLTGSREFAVLAQETEPLLEGSDQILAITDVLIAGDRRFNNNSRSSNQFDWYSILGFDRRTDDPDLIKRSYRRLALLLHPDKNKFPLADSAFKLVFDAWAVLSDPSKKSRYDAEFHLFSRVDLGPKPPPTTQTQFPHHKLPVRRSSRGAEAATNSTPAAASKSSFWTACPYCYILYEYPTVYKDCCLRCQNCQRAFHAAPVTSLPPRVPGKEAYYCCWGFFPLGYSMASSDAAAKEGKNPNSGFPNWMPPMFSQPSSAPTTSAAAAAAPSTSRGPMEDGRVDLSDGGVSAGLAQAVPVSHPPGVAPTSKKRGRPRKNAF